MKTLLAFIEYDGSAFYGSQSQERLPSVAASLQAALHSMGIASKARFSGRTDRGVHARNQAVSFEIPYQITRESLCLKLNHKLAPHIRIRRLYEAPALFNPRFKARTRTYRYIMSGAVHAFNARYVTRGEITQESLIKEALQKIVGRHDFSLFKKNGSGEKNSTRTIYSAKLYKYRDFWIFRITGDSFLRLQIRLLIGALLELDRGIITLEQFMLQLRAQERYTHTPAPSYGLYLCGVGFGEELWRGNFGEL